MKSMNTLAALPRTSLLQALHARGEALLLLYALSCTALCREDMILDPADFALLPAVLKHQVQIQGSAEGGKNFNSRIGVLTTLLLHCS